MAKNPFKWIFKRGGFHFTAVISFFIFASCGEKLEQNKEDEIAVVNNSTANEEQESQFPLQKLQKGKPAHSFKEAFQFTLLVIVQF